MIHKEKPFYRSKYQFELVETLTGKRKEAIKRTMQRKKMSLTDYIIYFVKKSLGKAKKEE